MELSGDRGVTVRAGDSLLAQRAAELLAEGPADSVQIVAYACNLPSPPLPVAERLASAIFSGRPEFIRGDDGRWSVCTPAPPARRTRSSAAADALSGLSFAVVDVETTGSLPAFGDRITEIAIFVIRGGVVTESFETLVNPERPIPPYVSRLTNITWDMVREAPTFREIAPQVVDALNGHVFAAHNATFDWRFVAAELGRSAGFQMDGRRLCTVKLARKLLPELSRRSLDHLARYYGVEIENRHRAGGDAMATARCLVRMLESARDRGCETWQDLEQLGRARKKRKRRVPAGPRPVTNDSSA